MNRRVSNNQSHRSKKTKKMKIVTYNVNGLRPRISQFGSLRKLLDSFDADIICFQETKLRRQELTADLVMADGYESFFSCTRTTDKGRTAYSGVATFCRVNSAFSSDEVALPVEAEEGFTGLHAKSQFKKEEKLHVKEGLEDFAIDELSKVDNEGRCIVTDHGHFVLFNIYGPRAVCDDAERIQFKHFFFQVLQKRWENLLHQRRIVIAVGDFNIAPKAIDRCDAEPDFENNEFRKWFRSMLVENGGPFYDVFRSKYPDRKDVFTCWPQNSGAEVFNFGSRIDHIISAGECLHQKYDLQGHNFVTCHVNGCDILTQYSRWKPQNEPSHRWKGGRNTKLEGSDHAPVCMSLVEIPNVSAHNTPSLSSRYLPAVRGLQQTIGEQLTLQSLTSYLTCTKCAVSVLMKRQVAAEQVNSPEASSSMSNEDMTLGRCSDNSASASDLPRTQHCDGVSARTDECSSVFPDVTIKSEHLKSLTSSKARKKAKKCQLSQLSLKSFFQKGSSTNNSAENAKTDAVLNEAEDLNSVHQLGELSHKDESRSPKQTEPCTSPLSGHEEKLSTCSTGQNKNNAALMEWQRIQEVMQNSIPLCKGHSEQCVARVVKKPGPNYGRRFYVCARAEGPSANPEANCGFFRWAAYKAGRK